MFDRRIGNKSYYGLGVKNFLTSRQRRRSGRVAALLSALAIVQGCSSLAMPGEATPPPQGVDPAYVRLIATYMKNNFKELSPYDPAEISTPRWVESVKGWTWFTCVHFMDHGHRRSYSLFFNQTEVLDARYAVLTDGCSKQTYSPLDLTSGGVRPGAFGDTGPLY
jgi:hypothetical protein